MKKVGKTTRLFRYDLNQIPYDYTKEMINKLKGLYVIDIMPKVLWMKVCEEAVINIIIKRKKCKKAKWLTDEAYKDILT